MSNTVRFGLGEPAGMRSDSWSVRTGADGSVYIAPRMLFKGSRGPIKVSLHPKRDDGTGGRWKVEYQPHFTDSRPDLFVDRGVDTIVDEWDSESQRLAPTGLLKQAYGVVLGRFSMAPHMTHEDNARAAEESAYLAKADWLRELPPIGFAYQWTVLIGDPDISFGPPGTRAMHAVEIGSFKTAQAGDVFVMRHLFEISTEMQSRIAEHAQTLASQSKARARPLTSRVTLIGKEDNGFRWSAEIALSSGFTDRELMVPPSEPNGTGTTDL